MTAKQYLRKIQWYEIKIEQRKFQLKGLYEDIDYLRGIDYSIDKVQTSPRDAMAEKVIRVQQLREEIVQKIADYEAARDEIIAQIQNVSNIAHSALLFKRYVERKKFELIAVEMAYNYAYTRSIHGEALKAFAEQFADAIEDAEAKSTQAGAREKAQENLQSDAPGGQSGRSC